MADECATMPATSLNTVRAALHTMPAVEQGVGLEKQGATPAELHPAAGKASGGDKAAAEDGPAPALRQQ